MMFVYGKLSEEEGKLGIPTQRYPGIRVVYIYARPPGGTGRKEGKVGGTINGHTLITAIMSPLGF